MTISLYYIEGISEIDTPYFDTLEEQKLYFNYKLIKDVDQTFYPPYYENVIKFSSDDLTLNDKINYLSFEYEDKTYYYFIKSISYISESVVELHCKLDSIQTFMFNISVSSGIIERMFINRWIGAYINRNYLRENVSKGMYNIFSYVPYTSSDMMDWFLVSKFDRFDKNVELLSVSTNSMNPSYPMLQETCPFDLKFTPIMSKTTEGITGGSSNIMIDAMSMIKGAYIENYVENYICPFNPLTNVVISKNTITAPYGEISYLNYEGMQGETIYYLHLDAIINKVFINTVNFGYTKNSSVGVLFSSNYCPCLLDNNYIKYTFGSRTVNTTYPLYELNNIYLYPKYVFSITTGQRIYYLNDNSTSLDDRFRTTAVDTNILSFDLKNSKWSSYMSSNKYRWAQICTTTTANVASSMLSMQTYNSSIDYSIDSIYSNSRNYTPKRHNLNAKSSREVESLEFNKSLKDAEYGNDIANNAISPIINQVYAEKNLLYSPMTIKSTGNANGSIQGYSPEIFSEIYRVNDYEQVAQYYHRNGYLVNKYVSNLGNTLFSLVNTRYYFNMLKFINGDIHLNILESNDIVDEINERLSFGFRLWNVVDSYTSNSITLRPYEIGNFSYDNVEKDYIS